MAAATGVKRTRTPSPFTPKTRVTVSLHNDLETDAANTSELGETLSELFRSEGFSVRLVSRVRKARKSRKTGQTAAAPSGPSSLMVYVAPADYKFATQAERGVRLDSETAKLLRSVAEKMGLDPNDPASIVAVAKALAQKANA